MVLSPSVTCTPSSTTHSPRVEDQKHCTSAKPEFNKKAKISLLGSSLYSLTEAVGRAIIGAFAWTGHFITLCCWQEAKSFGMMQIEKAVQAGSKAFHSFHSIFYAKDLNEKSKTEKHTSDQSPQTSAQIKTKIQQGKPAEKASHSAARQTHFASKEEVREPRKATPPQTSYFSKQPDNASPQTQTLPISVSPQHTLQTNSRIAPKIKALQDRFQPMSNTPSSVQTSREESKTEQKQEDRKPQSDALPSVKPPQTPSPYDLYFAPHLIPVLAPTSGFPQVSGNKQDSIAETDDLMPSQGSSSGPQEIEEMSVFNPSSSETSHEESKKEQEEILSEFSLPLSFASPQISGKEEDLIIPADDLMPPQGSSSGSQEIEGTPVFNPSVSPQVHEETKEEQKQEIQKLRFEPPVCGPDDPMRFEWTIHDASKIPDKLKTQLERAQAQADREVDKPFKWLSAPADFEAETFSQEIGGYSVAGCSFIGRRPSMEDESLATEFNLNIQGTSYPVQLFGIFDGHGGGAASLYTKENIERVLHETLLQFGSDGLTEDAIWNALKITNVKLTDEFKKETSGTTANVAMFLGDKIHISNVADSRAILDDGRQLSEDQKLKDNYYIRGIKKRGNQLFFGRFNGNLAVPRAIGDRDMWADPKSPISARPKLTAIANPKEGHLISGCDGIYDVASTRQVAKGVREHADLSAAELARTIVYSAYKAESMDNLSVLVIKLSQRQDS